jgi:hypothetical protein
LDVQPENRRAAEALPTPSTALDPPSINLEKIVSTIIAHPAQEAHPDRDAAARKRADRLAKATTDQMQAALAYLSMIELLHGSRTGDPIGFFWKGTGSNAQESQEVFS